MSDAPPILQERENGPLIAKNVTRLFDETGAELDVKPVMALCRCGQSKSKPFCDGSHTAAGFESRGGKPEGPDRFFTYEGKEVTVSFNPRLCGHAAECGRIASHIFDVAQKPWVQPDQGTVEEVKAVVAACPSGALQMGVPPETLVTGAAEVRVSKDGPLWVKGVAIDTDTAATGMPSDKFILCRCGKSGNKPFCDGTHRAAGWKSS